MALSHLGTNANNSLSSLIFSGNMSAANVAALALLIKDDENSSHPVWPGAFSSNGLLYVPNRGVLKVLAGDYVGVDATTGWPILVSKNAIASGPYTVS